MRERTVNEFMAVFTDGESRTVPWAEKRLLWVVSKVGEWALFENGPMLPVGGQKSEW
jgi:hypothetical protein